MNKYLTFNTKQNRFPKVSSYAQQSIYALFSKHEIFNEDNFQSQILHVVEEVIPQVAGESDKDIVLFVTEQNPDFVFNTYPNHTVSFIQSAIICSTLMIIGNVIEQINKTNNYSDAFKLLSDFESRLTTFVHLFVTSNYETFEKTIQRRSPSSDNSKSFESIS